MQLSIKSVYRPNKSSSWQNHQNDMCFQQRLRSDWADGHSPSLIRVFADRMKKAWVLSYPLSTQWRLWSDWADAQADLSLRWVHSNFDGFVVKRLNFCLLSCQVAHLQRQVFLSHGSSNLSQSMSKPIKWCAPGKNRSAKAFAQSDQSLLCEWRNLGSLASSSAHSKDSDQTIVDM